MPDKAIVLFLLFAPTLAALVALFAGWSGARRRFSGRLAATCKVVALLAPLWSPWLLQKIPGSGDPSTALATALWLGVPLVLLGNSWPIFFSDLRDSRKMLAFGGYLFAAMPTILLNSLPLACMLDAKGCH